MAEFRYRAYLSYSHRDERWAAWLHRALESYRVPRQLVGRTTAAGVVPSRIRPVFRDRADLSSAADLDATLKQALADSDSLIVLCSPAAAASEWVAREIRDFARHGRTARIFCLIVDSDADDSVEACFPGVLAEIGLREPLAADARKWADGKRRAKLKLIAGLLGVKLDELLQRDLQRRRMRQVVTGAAGATVLSLAVLAVTSQLSERRAREDNERIASFLVDHAESLKNTDLSTLARVSAESYKYLREIDPDRLSPETGEKVALALRQMGRASQGQGQPDQALDAYTQSRDLLERLLAKYPDERSLLFELSNAVFYIGALQRKQRQYQDALASMQRYFELTHALWASDPEDADWIKELGNAHINLAALRLEAGTGIDETTLGHVSEAIRLMEQAMALQPEDIDIVDNYATNLAWWADAQRSTCNLEKMVELRDRARELAESASRSDPANHARKRRYAYALTGVARVQKLTGNLNQAIENLERAIAILRQLSGVDPSNVVYHKNITEREAMLADLLAEMGQLDVADERLRELAPRIRAAFEETSDHEAYVGFLLDRADLAFRRGEAASARRHLQTAQRLLDEHENPRTGGLFDWQRLADAKYQWWRLTGRAELGDLPDAPTVAPTPALYRSCNEADFLARIHVMKDQRQEAAAEVQYLQLRGYAEPSFVRFCRRHGLCPD